MLLDVEPLRRPLTLFIAGPLPGVEDQGDGDYAARYSGSVDVADIAALEQNRRDLSFRDGAPETSLAADLIGRWEALVGVEFKYDLYEIVLCSAIKNGPSANSLGYERSVFYSGDDMDYLRKFISHEVGTHILFPMLKNLSEGRDPSLSYKAFESLARFYNSLILQTSDLYPMGPSYDVDTFFRIYESIYKSRPTISPAELAIEGLSRYSQG